MIKAKYDISFILNNVVFACARGAYLISESQTLEGVHAVLCAKEIFDLLQKKALVLGIKEREPFETHNEGKQKVCHWAKSQGLDFDEEIDISIGVADILVYGDDIGIFEIGITRPTKMLLLLKYIVRENRPITVHFWPYGTIKAFVFKNWR